MAWESGGPTSVGLRRHRVPGSAEGGRSESPSAQKHRQIVSGRSAVRPDPSRRGEGAQSLLRHKRSGSFGPSRSDRVGAASGLACLFGQPALCWARLRLRYHQTLGVRRPYRKGGGAGPAHCAVPDTTGGAQRRQARCRSPLRRRRERCRRHVRRRRSGRGCASRLLGLVVPWTFLHERHAYPEGDLGLVEEDSEPRVDSPLGALHRLRCREVRRDLQDGRRHELRAEFPRLGRRAPHPNDGHRTPAII